MNYQIKSRFKGAVLFEGEFGSLKLCVTAAVEASANLRGADLSGAYLRGADLRCACLRDADLSGACLRDADLSGADLSGADLSGADLRCACLRDADLSGADLSGADLSGAYLRGACLRDADLSGADLSGADLSGACLRGADLRCACLRGADLRDAGNNAEIRLIQTGIYEVSYTSDVMQIGCKRFPITDWWNFSDEEIADMDSRALVFWKVWKPLLQQIIAAAPATPTKVETAETEAAA
jgi:hypothetical protein